MNGRRHRIEVFEPADYDGPQPLLASGIRIVESPDRTPAYLLVLQAPLQLEAGAITQLLVRSRHGDPVDRCVESVCTVVIYAVIPGKELDEDAGCFKFTEVVNWGIGKIAPTQASGA
jgi:hypothetical protein